MTVVYLARHGQTEWWQGNRFAGRTDVALTQLGLQQAKRLGAWAGTLPLARVISSDLQRARMTAEPAAAAAQVSLETDSRLREVDFGEAEGMTPEELAETFPEAERIFRAAPASHGLPGGEDGSHAIARFTSALAEIVAAAGPDDNVLIVAHGTVIRLVLASLLGIDPNDYRRRFVNPGNDAVTSVRFDPSVGLPSAMLLRFNERI